MEAGWLQFPVVTQHSINSLAATQCSISLWLPDPKDPRHFAVGEDLERPAYLSEAKRGSRFSSAPPVHSLGRVLEVGEAQGSFPQWFLLPQSRGSGLLWRRP